MSGRLLHFRTAQLFSQCPGVLEITDALEGQLDEVSIADEQGDEVQRSGYDLHRRDEERVEEPLSLLADPRELLPELRGEILREERRHWRRAVRGLAAADPLTLDDGHDRRRSRRGEEEPGQASDAEPGDARDSERARDPQIEVAR